MDLIETLPDAEIEPRPRTVTLELYPDAAELLDELTRRTGLDASELVGWALGAYWRELEGIVLPPLEPATFQDMEQVLRKSEEDFKAGRFSTNEEVFARIDAKHGW